LITFDVTGTLLKFRKSPVELYAECGARHGVIVQNQEKLKEAFKQQWKFMNSEMPNYGTCWRTWWTEFVIGTFRNGGITENMASRTKLVTVASDLIEQFSTSACWEPKDGAQDLLSALKSSSHLKPQIGVISNFDPRLNKILEATKLANFFDFVLNSHECQVSKPDPKIFKMALTAAGQNSSTGGEILPSDALHIGDNYELDYIGATNSGWNSVLVIEDSKDVPTSVPSSIIFPNLHKLQEFLVVQRS
jgi:REG-2-like HAD superfamily hydrolase